MIPVIPFFLLVKYPMLFIVSVSSLIIIVIVIPVFEAPGNYGEGMGLNLPKMVAIPLWGNGDPAAELAARGIVF